MGEKDASFIPEEMVTVHGKGKGQLYGDMYQTAGNILTTVYQIADNKF
jgi:hypothetical protein